VPWQCAGSSKHLRLILVRGDVHRRASSLAAAEDASHRVLRPPAVRTSARRGSMSRHCRSVSKKSLTRAAAIRRLVCKRCDGEWRCRCAASSTDRATVTGASLRVWMVQDDCIGSRRRTSTRRIDAEFGSRCSTCSSQKRSLRHRPTKTAAPLGPQHTQTTLPRDGLHATQ